MLDFTIKITVKVLKLFNVFEKKIDRKIKKEEQELQSQEYERLP